ncbi:hypothetical protein D3C77_433220 [compost metagenome]
MNGKPCPSNFQCIGPLVSGPVFFVLGHDRCLVGSKLGLLIGYGISPPMHAVSGSQYPDNTGDTPAQDRTYVMNVHVIDLCLVVNESDETKPGSSQYQG